MRSKGDERPRAAGIRAIEIVVSVTIACLLALIAVPGLIRVHIANNEAAAMRVLREINLGEARYASICGSGGYTRNIEDLAKPPAGGGQPFISPQLGANGAVQHGYVFSITASDAPGLTTLGTAAATCNGSEAAPVSAYYASADPVTVGATGARHFATDQRGAIYADLSNLPNPIPGRVPAVQQ